MRQRTSLFSRDIDFTYSSAVEGIGAAAFTDASEVEAATLFILCPSLRGKDNIGVSMDLPYSQSEVMMLRLNFFMDSASCQGSVGVALNLGDHLC